MLHKTYPSTTLEASENYVGLPDGQMGNSEVGHMTIGAGRILRQGLVEIDHAIEEGSFTRHPLLNDLVKNTSSTRCHLMGLFSDGGIHSHIHHLIHTSEFLATQGIEVFLHLFTDGRDTPPQSALGFIKQLPQHPFIKVATVQGRFYAMDRDKRWERTHQAYDAIVFGKGIRIDTAQDAVTSSYNNDITDEFILPHIIGHYDGMQDGDSIIHINFRSDRVRQLLSSLVIPSFQEFARQKVVHFSKVLGMSDYGEDLAPYVCALYPSVKVTDTLTHILTQHHKKTLKVAETEKYAHVTFFFNGGVEEPCALEDRILVPSPKVSTYDLAPEMGAVEITDHVIQAMSKQSHELIVVNYANPDMVGHTGVQDAIIKAIECVDRCLGRIHTAAIDHDYTVFITADHGNAEQMTEAHDSSNPHTAHTCNPVPFIVVNLPSHSLHSRTLHSGTLADIAPTLLTLYGITPPQTMSGQCLIK